MSKRITLSRLELHNFKGVAALAIDFHTDRPTVLSGRNGTGKTTVADAFMWLLWGVNSESQTTAKFGIRPNGPDGTARLDLDTEVEGTLRTLDTDTGEESTLKLKRRWVSVWKTRSCEVERIFDKNKGEYYINDVPVKQEDYNAAVAAVIAPEIFKPITNPYYFPNLPWEKRREILLGLTDDVTFADIAAGHAEFAQFLRDLSGKTVEDFHAELNAAIGRINKRLEDIPKLIAEDERHRPLAPDCEALKAERAEVQREISALNAAMAAGSEAAAAREAAKTAAVTRLGELGRKQQTMLDAARDAAWAEARKANGKRDELLREQRNLESRWQANEHNFRLQADKKKREAEQQRSEAARMEQEQSRLRQRWYDENSKQYISGGALVCPITGQACADPDACGKHATDEEWARQAFIDNQRRNLEEITGRGRELGTAIAETQAMADAADEEVEGIRAAYALAKEQYQAEMQRIAAQLAANPEQKAVAVKGEDLPQWVELEKEIRRLKQQLDSTIPEDSDSRATAAARKRAMSDRIAEIDRKLGLQTIIEHLDRRIADLKAEERRLMQERADMQKQQKTIERLTKTRMNELEKRINSRFKMVRFEMFEPTATTGDEKPNCVCWVGEAKYNDKNRAGKVNAGLDIINTLCAHHRISAPVFIDNAEGVNDFIATDSQLILLKVTNEDFKVE